MPAPTIHSSKVVGRHRLYLDVLYDPDRTGRFFMWPHPTPAAFEACARHLARPPVQRKVASAMLVRQNEALGAPPAAIAAAASLAEANSVCVFTGQQAGLLTGPLYTIHKAVTILNWTRRLAEVLNRPVVPVFWIASDDHDFEEIRWTALPNKQNQIERLTLNVPGLPPRTPASQVVLGDGIHDVLAQLWEAQIATEFTPELREAISSFYRSDSTMTDAFARLLSMLFGKHGLVMFDPADPEAKALCAPLFAQEISGHAQTASALGEIGQRLNESGYHQQVDHPEGHTHLFYVENGRHAIHGTDGQLWTDPEKTALDPDIWLARLSDSPAAFSPGVLMRPVAQSYLFPVVAVVCGPSEIAYWAQSRALFDRFDVTMPVVLPRMSATIIEKKIQAGVEALGHEVAEFFGDVEELINKHFEKSFPTDLTSKFEIEKKDTLARLEMLKGIVTGFEPTLARTFDVDAGKIAAIWGHLEDKVFQAHKRKGDEIRARFYKLAVHLRPEGRPQERVFGIVYYINKYGLGFAERIIEQLPVGAPDHRIIVP
jgi:bacillithiol biosynthesis cysteine-adding enzyme BshC